MRQRNFTGPRNQLNSSEDKDGWREYARQNIIRSQYGDPPSDYSPGLLICPFFKVQCMTSRCAGWHQERRFCWLIWGNLALSGGQNE